MPCGVGVARPRGGVDNAVPDRVVKKHFLPHTLSRPPTHSSKPRTRRNPTGKRTRLVRGGRDAANADVAAQPELPGPSSTALNGVASRAKTCGTDVCGVETSTSPADGSSTSSQHGGIVISELHDLGPLTPDTLRAGLGRRGRLTPPHSSRAIPTTTPPTTETTTRSSAASGTGGKEPQSPYAKEREPDPAPQALRGGGGVGGRARAAAAPRSDGKAGSTLCGGGSITFPRRAPPPATVGGGARGRRPSSARKRPRPGVDVDRLARDLRALLRRGTSSWVDSELVEVLERYGERGGFPTDFQGAHRTIVVPNGKSVYEHAVYVHAEMAKELKEGYITVYDEANPIPYAWYRVSPLFVIPKTSSGLHKSKNGVLQYRLINNMSAPEGDSINDGSLISIETKGMFEDVRDAARKVLALRTRGGSISIDDPDKVAVRLCKVDLSAAYKQWHVESSSRHLFGMQWFRPDRPLPEYALHGEAPRPGDGVTAFSNVLNFGFARSVEWFHRISLALKALLHDPGTEGIGAPLPEGSFESSIYLDDAFLMAWESQAEALKARYLALLALYRIPVSEDKAADMVVSAVKDFLGVEFDAERDELRMSEVRIKAIRARLEGLRGKAYCETKELASVTGLLSFASQCCAPARTYMRRLWTALGGHKRRTRYTRLGRGVQCDLEWFRSLWATHNGVFLVPEEEWKSAAQIDLWTDASLWGFGVVVRLPDGTVEYLTGEWGTLGEGLSINALELLAVLIACEQYGHLWSRRKIRMHCDNQASCFTLSSGASRSATMMVAQREIALVAARHHFQLRGDYIRSASNVGADAASRDDVARLEAWVALMFGPDAPLSQAQPLCDVKAMLRRMQRARKGEARRALGRDAR